MTDEIDLILAGEKSSEEAATTAVGAEGEKAAGKKAPAGKIRKGKKKVVKHVPVGIAHVKATYNNTIISLTDPVGNVLSWSSAGICGFKGPKKATPYAASIIVKDAVEKAQPYGLVDVTVLVRGVASGREGAIRALNANGLNVLSIKDLTPIPHNGCRPKKVRRV